MLVLSIILSAIGLKSAGVVRTRNIIGVQTGKCGMLLVGKLLREG